jgi:putative ABC transport system permease protein
MFVRFTLRALRYRKQRLMLAFGALAVAAALATVLFAIYGSVERRLREQFSAYGANLVAVPANGSTIPLEIAPAADRLGAEAAPFLVTSVPLNGNAVPVAGFMPDKTAPLTRYWHMQGTRDIRSGECIAGEQLGLHLGDTLAPVESCVVKGIVSTGGAEDGEILIPWEVAESISGLRNSASVIEIRAPGERLEAIRQSLAGHYPTAEFRTVRAVAEAEAGVVLKIRTAVFLLMLLILTITALCVLSNFSEMVAERAKEIGILKALGAAERRIAGFFVSESAVLALAATIAGYAVGVIGAAAIGKQIFGGAFHAQVDWFVFLVVAIVMLSVAAVATAVAASRIWNIHSAVILRGE